MMRTEKSAIDSTLTLDELTVAIRNGIDKEGMPDEQAKEMAQHILNFFGYSERIIDNILEPEDRDAFYMLEDTGILTTEREETTLYDGREWRIHYWLFRKERIHQLIERNPSWKGTSPGRSQYTMSLLKRRGKEEHRHQFPLRSTHRKAHLAPGTEFGGWTFSHTPQGHIRQSWSRRSPQM